MSWENEDPLYHLERKNLIEVVQHRISEVGSIRSVRPNTTCHNGRGAKFGDGQAIGSRVADGLLIGFYKCWVRILKVILSESCDVTLSKDVALAHTDA